VLELTNLSKWNRYKQDHTFRGVSRY